MENSRTFIPLFRPASIDSNVTADNLPGPGRNLSLLYALLGQKLESRMNSFASRRKNRQDPAATLHRVDSVDSNGSIDSNSTADNLPGPGRNLGKLYVHLGEKLVNSLGKFLARRGYGPEATAQAISALRQHEDQYIYDIYVTCAVQSVSGRMPNDIERIKLEKKCKKLVSYSRSRSESTAIIACNFITNLALYDPYLRRILFNCLPSFDSALLAGLEQNLKESSTEIEVDPLLASSRKALISVTEVEFYVATAPGGLISKDAKQWFIGMDSFILKLERLLKEEVALSFLGLRHILHTFQNATHFIGAVREDASWISQSDKFVRVIFHLMGILRNYLESMLRGDVSVAAIDWDTLEAILGRDGSDSIWVARLFSLYSYEFQEEDCIGELLDRRSSDVYGSSIREEIDVIFTYPHFFCMELFSDLCYRHDRGWIRPIYDEE
ncbi:hypothetical protein SCHPADRAFT_926465 [Schizopora paradoxa]|uniref:Uncharacterized protein n=1 Tax=Schizopora paradoxa TaxID=27342 RepID=A0A0H2RYC5_9AGAM|nr:hypothetical protein SCHPADRAFT_926465 [Schizopora paradoxa]